MKKIICLLTAVLLFSCHTDSIREDQNPMNLEDLSFMVITDPHYLSPLLYDKGTAFYESVNRKSGLLPEYGDEIITAAGKTAEDRKPDFILIAGDLTYDGEMQSHVDFANHLKRIEESGTPVYVIPGNHDTNSTNAYSYMATYRKKTETISPGQFLTIYRDFGYDDSVDWDVTSLSYSVPIKNDYLLIGLDSNIYGRGAGRVRESTLIWLEEKLIQADNGGRQVILFLHHSLLEHYDGQNKDNDLLQNRKDLRVLLEKYRIQMVFTGHYHAQNIAAHEYDGHYLYDIQTAALTSWPFNYRMVNISGNTIKIRSHRLAVNGLETSGEQLSYSRIYTFSSDFLTRYGVREQDAEKIGHYVAEIFFRHIQGDENSTPPPEKPEGLGFMGKMALTFGKRLYHGRQFDTFPGDNNLDINLETTISSEVD